MVEPRRADWTSVAIFLVLAEQSMAIIQYGVTMLAGVAAIVALVRSDRTTPDRPT